ncbi:glycosyltransferase [Epidermidibacterium keratini]|uniref:Glycosyltransferase n=1 Tax=Epidermidibacterium keratini TaxID=1891644 RepID=A0A7L4YTU3_9ACTN|nr:glycosyltransferase [Epidermidibacterium keratini]
MWHLRHGGISQVREWRRRQLADKRAAPRQIRATSDFDPMDLPRHVPTPLAAPFGELRVGVIMDDFSLRAWSHEFTTVELTPNAWREQIADGLDFLLVESAWSGNHAAWQYQLTGPSAPSSDLRELVTFCREATIPTVFWNKEDPPHFHDFLDTARLFDFVFTSDSTKIAEYVAALGHDRVAALSFAAQPAIHNPIRIPSLHQKGDIAFAGMYFAHKYPERRQQMDMLLGAAERVGARMRTGLTIYSRFAGADERYQFPSPYAEHVVGALPYETMLSAYRAFKVFLNVNSVVDSPSMCARRIFEITASGTPVISAPSAAVPEFFSADEVPVAADEEEAGWLMRTYVNSPQLRDRTVHRAQRKIFSRHTYTHRAATILEHVGVTVSNDPLQPPSVSVICSTNRPAQLDHLLQQVAAQRGVDIQLVVLTHGFEPDPRLLRATADRHGIEQLQTIYGSPQWTLGECLNQLVDAADGDLVAKFDDDDFYGPHYLLDQCAALRYSGADLVGKQASYLYMASHDAIVLRYPEREHRWTTFVAGPTLVAPTTTFRQVRFARVNRGEDTRLLRELSATGAQIYSADRFSFLQIRGRHGHTWRVDDAELLANSVVETYGPHLSHVLAD